jgi:small subunit ribosomal protein S11
MGKKHVVTQNQEELIKEGEKIEAKVQKEAKETSLRLKEGRIYVFSSYNNTIITLSDPKGDVLHWKSAGQLGFKGSKKSTPFAASKVAEAVVQVAKKMGIEKISVFVRGIGSGRESALRSVAAHGLEIISIKDVTPVPHNGCRPPKVRRV